MSRWIPILVRLEDYQEITALIAEREAGRDPSEQAIQVSDVMGPGIASTRTMTQEEAELARHKPWDEADLARLAEGRTATTQRWCRAMDVCAVKAEEWLPTSVVAERAGMTINEWRDAPRKITRHLRAHFPGVPRAQNGEAEWPLCVGGSGIPAARGEVYWAITTEMARRWKTVRGTE
jgi:hypothetical protein